MAHPTQNYVTCGISGLFLFFSNQGCERLIVGVDVETTDGGVVLTSKKGVVGTGWVVVTVFVMVTVGPGVVSVTVLVIVT
jgi:hypothetical protein